MQRTFTMQDRAPDGCDGSVRGGGGRRSFRFSVVLCLALVCALVGSVVAAQTVHAQRQGERTHVVQQGETLGQIAQRYGIDWRDLAEWNGISDPSRVNSGQTLALYGNSRGGNSSWGAAASGSSQAGQSSRGHAAWSNEAPASGSSGSSAWGSSGGSDWGSSSASGGTHVVQEGETLVGIAQRYGVTPPQLVRENNLSRPPFLYPGQTLILPGGSSGSADWGLQQQNTQPRTQPETQQSWGASSSYGVQTPEAPTQVGKVILISIAQQHLWAFENGRLVLQTPVTTGRPGADTPTGTYDVLVKYSPYRFVSPYPPGHEFYYEPVDSNYSLRITWNGHHIHDAPWRSDFGPGTNLPHNNSSGQWATGSIGCVNVPTSAMAQLYNWADEGIQVTIQ